MNNEKELPFWDHLEELRTRIFRCLWVILGTGCFAYLFRNPIQLFLKKPLFDVLPPDKQHLIFTGVFESFMNSLKVSAIAGVFLALPYIFYEFWKFIAPGMHAHEKKMMVPFIILATIFFTLGAAFAYYFVFPHGFKFMLEFGEPYDVPMISVKEYFNMIFKLLLLFGLSFEFPVVLLFLAKIGIIDDKNLVEHRRTAIIAIGVLCALFAPPDIMSMLLMMAPLYIFYELVILVIRYGMKKKPPE